MWIKKAAEGGDADAQSQLGDAYEDGLLGSKIDIEMALMWFKKAAEDGDFYAQWRLGKAYEFGELTLAIDLEAARTCYQEAAEGGDGDAQRRLGTAYEFGELTLAIDLEAARTWYHEAAEGGETLAQHQLFWRPTQTGHKASRPISRRRSCGCGTFPGISVLESAKERPSAWPSVVFMEPWSTLGPLLTQATLSTRPNLFNAAPWVGQRRQTGPPPLCRPFPGISVLENAK